MPRIGRFPPFGKRFFRRARKLIGSCHFAHFWRAVMSLAAMQGRRSMRKLEACCRNHATRQSIGFFLSKAHWDAPELLAETAIDTLKSLGWKSGDALHLVPDAFIWTDDALYLARPLIKRHWTMRQAMRDAARIVRDVQQGGAAYPFPEVA